ncbi:MAG: branched-chain amino acid ABC transporter permease, partial [Pseudomonadota bacterium]
KCKDQKRDHDCVKKELVLALAAVGLNILTGYTGQISLGTGAFMGVGAYACYKLTLAFPDVNVIALIVFSGFFSALAGVFFGLPSLRIKGFYLVVTTLAAQFFLEWAFIRIPWLYNYNASGAIEVPQREAFGVIVTGAAASSEARYLVVLSVVVVMTWIASNILSGRIGRSWMMIRDMDIAAELMGVRPLYAKLSAFAVSSFYCGVAGALMVFIWQGAAEVEVFDYNRSFQILFMVILGGLGSLLGCFLGAAVIFILPIIIHNILPPVYAALTPFTMTSSQADLIAELLIGVLIVAFLILEPHGLARLWAILKQKLRVWPFPY